MAKESSPRPANRVGRNRQQGKGTEAGTGWRARTAVAKIIELAEWKYLRVIGSRSSAVTNIDEAAHNAVVGA